MVFHWMSQTEPWFDPVMILAPYTLPFEVAPMFEIDQDSLHGPFCNQHLHCNVSNADVRRGTDAMEDMRMVAQKRPIRML
jgi:hypothetical protein